MKVVLISCVSKKLNCQASAKDMYISPLFKLNLQYSKLLSPDKVFVLSAKYGLIKLDDKIKPYDMTLNNMSNEEIKLWAGKVIEKLKNEIDLEKDEVVFLAGKKYRKHLIPHIKNYKAPMKNLGIGKQLRFLKEKVNAASSTCSTCHKLHSLFNGLKRFKFPFNEEKIPKNGIYVLFEKGEKAHGGDRVVRVGTHTGVNNLRSRLKEHFINENKDRSIFRKNIGRCLLRNDPFLKDWELTPLIREIKIKHPNIDFNKQKQIEKQVSKIIREKFTFCIVPVDDKDERLEIESKIISSISLCKECKPSGDWFGLLSTKEKIRQSGLWLVNELYKEPLSESGVDELKGLLKL